MKGLIFFLGVIAIASLISCSTRVVTPKITCTPLEEVITFQPNCTQPILSALNNLSKSSMQDAFWCYDRTIQHWVDAYERCEVRTKTTNGDGDK